MLQITVKKFEGFVVFILLNLYPKFRFQVGRQRFVLYLTVQITQFMRIFFEARGIRCAGLLRPDQKQKELSLPLR